MRVRKIAEASFEVTTDVGVVLGWIDLERRLAQDGSDTVEERAVAKPVVGAAWAASTLGEAAAFVASTCN